MMRALALAGVVIAAPSSAAEWHVAQRPENAVVIYAEANGASTGKPMLAFQCGGREPSVTIYWHAPMAGHHAQSVALSIDGAKRENTWWRISTDQKTLGVWGPDAVPLARRLLGKAGLSVWAIDRRGKRVVGQFDLKGLDRAILSVAHQCQALSVYARAEPRPHAWFRFW